MIAIPSNRDPKHHFQTSLLKLVMFLQAAKVDFAINPEHNISNLVYGRQAMLNKGLNEGYSHLLFIDNDMYFESGAFDFMQSRKKDFIAANCVPKPDVEFAFKTPEYSLTPVSKDFDDNYVLSKGKTGTEKVASTGLAFALIKLDAIRKIPAPHFRMDEYGEDRNFCSLLRENNIDVFIDHDATKHVAHIGDHPFREIS